MRSTSARYLKLAVVVVGLFLAGRAGAENWPQWRGPKNDGISQETKLPAQWSDSKGIAWKLKLPGPAGSTPAIWGDRIFLTTPEDKDMVVLCVSTEGKEIWRTKVGNSGKWFHNDEGNESSPSPSTDGKHVYAYFGNGDFVCLDVQGKEVWRFNAQERYGKYRIMHGVHITPALHGDRLYLPLLHQGGQWVVALEKATGKEVWKVARPTDGRNEGEHSYASPSIWTNGKEAYLVVHGCDYCTAHNLEDGKEIWRLGDLNSKVKYDASLRLVASPLVTPDLIVVPTAKNKFMIGLKPDAKGTINAGSPSELWRHPSGTPDVPSPLIRDGLLYICHENGVWVACFEAMTGKELYKHSTLHRTRYRASPVYADGKVYLTARDGTFTVIKAGAKFEQLAVNKLPDTFTASPAIANGRIYLRGWENLYAIGEAK